MLDSLDLIDSQKVDERCKVSNNLSCFSIYQYLYEMTLKRSPKIPNTLFWTNVRTFPISNVREATA